MPSAEYLTETVSRDVDAVDISTQDTISGTFASENGAVYTELVEVETNNVSIFVGFDPRTITLTAEIITENGTIVNEFTVDSVTIENNTETVSFSGNQTLNTYIQKGKEIRYKFSSSNPSKVEWAEAQTVEITSTVLGRRAI